MDGITLDTGETKDSISIFISLQTLDYILRIFKFLLKVFKEWNEGPLESYLIEITSHIFNYRNPDGSYLIDQILDAAGQVCDWWHSFLSLQETFLGFFLYLSFLILLGGNFIVIPLLYASSNWTIIHLFRSEQPISITYFHVKMYVPPLYMNLQSFSRSQRTPYRNCMSSKVGILE